jgi:RNA polymerase sigma factor (TIGR02999 family)
MGETTHLLARARDGDAAAWNGVVTLLYDELLQLARRRVRRGHAFTLSATALVHECYLRLPAERAAALTSRQHLLALASRAMRQILVNHARDRVAAKRGGGVLHLSLDDEQPATLREADQVLMLDQALERLAHQDAALAQIVDCRVFGGLTEQETVTALALPLRTVQRRWAQARQRLRDCLREA